MPSVICDNPIIDSTVSIWKCSRLAASFFLVDEWTPPPFDDSMVRSLLLAAQNAETCGKIKPRHSGDMSSNVLSATMVMMVIGQTSVYIASMCQWWVCVRGWYASAQNIEVCVLKYMAGLRSLWVYVHGGSASMAGLCPWRICINGKSTSMAGMCPWPVS